MEIVHSVKVCMLDMVYMIPVLFIFKTGRPIQLLLRLRNSAGEDIDFDTQVYVESDDIIRILCKQLNRGTVERLRNENKQSLCRRI